MAPLLLPLFCDRPTGVWRTIASAISSWFNATISWGNASVVSVASSDTWARPIASTALLQRLGVGRLTPAAGKLSAEAEQPLGHLGRRRLQLALSTRDDSGVVVNPFTPGHAVQLPRGNNDLFLRRRQLTQARSHSPAGLTVGDRELLVERPDFEEKNIAPAVGGQAAATHVPRAYIVGHEVARRDIQILHEQRAGPGDSRRAARAREENRPFLTAAYRIDQLKAVDTVVIVCSGFDRDFLERGDLAVTSRPQDPHVGRAFVDRPDEVLSVAGRTQAVDVEQRDPVGAVLQHIEGDD